jgi:hypothetical protein
MAAMLKAKNEANEARTRKSYRSIQGSLAGKAAVIRYFGDNAVAD